ncbi:TRAP transporter small permease [Deferrisoma sp.]
MKHLQAASAALNRAVEALLCVLAIGMSALTLAQVVARYGLNHSIFWSEEVGRMILIALTFLGASAAWARGAHIGIDVLTGRLPGGVRRWAQAFACLCGMAFGLFLAIYGAEFAWFARRGVMSATGLSRSVPAAVVPLGGAILAFHAFVDLLATLRGGGARE